MGPGGADGIGGRGKIGSTLGKIANRDDDGPRFQALVNQQARAMGIDLDDPATKPEERAAVFTAAANEGLKDPQLRTMAADVLKQMDEQFQKLGRSGEGWSYQSRRAASTIEGLVAKHSRAMGIPLTNAAPLDRARVIGAAMTEALQSDQPDVRMMASDALKQIEQFKQLKAAAEKLVAFTPKSNGWTPA